ncbi:MAG: transporter, partial [Bacteroidales bacterium]|nr:transporter [Bacteroidales bacterium]
MEWLKDLFFTESVSYTILIYSIVIALGVLLGKIKIAGVSLGIAFVLFAGIALGHFGFSANHQVVDFIKDFGLILFVFSIGLQVGPGFFSSFRREGLTLNILGVFIVLLGGLITVLLHFISGTSLPMLVGVMSGAVTNTPGLGAAQQALSQISNAADIPQISLGYAVAYPFGVLGIILSMLSIRMIFRINVDHELTLFNSHQQPEEELPGKISVLVTNDEISGETIRSLTEIIDHSFVITRILHNGEIISGGPDSVIYVNDVIFV